MLIYSILKMFQSFYDWKILLKVKQTKKSCRKEKKTSCKSTLRCTRWIMQRQETYTIRLIIHSFTVLNPFCLFRCILPTIFLLFSTVAFDNSSYPTLLKLFRTAIMKHNVHSPRVNSKTRRKRPNSKTFHLSFFSLSRKSYHCYQTLLF